MKYQEIRKEHRQLFFEDEIFKGFYNYEKIQTGISGVDERIFLNKVRNNLKNIYETYGEESMKEMNIHNIPENSELINYYKLAQVLLHESFHVYQSFNLKGLNEYVYAIRKVNEAEFKIFYNSIINGFKWKFGEQIINNRLNDFYKNSEEYWLFEELEYLSSKYTPIFNDFINNQNHQLNTIDIVESQAFIFQEYSLDCIGKNLFKPKKNSIYLKAYHYYFNKTLFVNDSESSYLIFLFISNISLKFGSSKEINGKQSTTHLFEYFCKNIKEVIKKFESIDLKSDYYLPAETWLEINGYNDDTLNSFEKQIFNRNTIFYDFLINLALKFFRGNIYNNEYFLKQEYQFYKAFDLSFDRKTIEINEALNKRYKGFDSKYYFPLMLSNTRKICLSLSWSIHGKEISQIEMKSVWGKENISNEMDSFLMQIVDDFESFLNNEDIICCEEHKNTNRKTILMNCDNIDSFRSRMKQMFGRNYELKNNLYVQ